MKRAIASLLGIVFLAACDQKPDGYSLKGHLIGDVADSTLVFLKHIGEDNQPVDVDTTTVTNGNFVFEGMGGQPEMHYLFIDKLPGYIAFVLENGNIGVTAHIDSLGLAKTSGTTQNDIFLDFREKSQALSKQSQSIQQDAQRASMERDTATMASLQDEWRELQEERKAFELDYIKTHPDALISALLVDKAIGSKQMTAEEIQQLYDGLSLEIQGTKAGKKAHKNLTELKERELRSKNSTVGAKAPDFSGPDPDGKQISLAEVKGKATLIDFWAAWCRPCRAENPNVVKVYKKYHDKGLNIIGVSLDRNANAWKKAIADDGLEWNHVSNIAYFNDPIAKLYNVDAIPAAFLLDENGVIVGKNLRGKALEAKVSELLD